MKNIINNKKSGQITVNMLLYKWYNKALLEKVLELALEGKQYFGQEKITNV